MYRRMSQFGATTKNPPWVRTSAQNMASTQQQQQQQQLQTQMLGQTMGTLGNPTMVQYQQPQQVFQTPMQMQQAGIAMTTMTAAMGTTGVAMPTALGTTQMFPQVATVSYPTPRALNPAAFQSSAVAASPAGVPPVPPATPNPSPKQRVFTGTVTKVHDNFGFVDEDVFFQTSCCVKGSNPVVGDRVLVEASYNPNMPFKWNATRIQVLPMSTTAAQRPAPNVGKGFNTGQGSYNAVPPPDDSWNEYSNHSPLHSSKGSASSLRKVENLGNSNFSRNNQPKPRRRERSKERGRETDEDETERKKRREERVREREEKEKEKRSPSVRRRSKSPRPRPRRSRIVPRYMVQIPKISLDLPDADVLELRRRYTNLYIPSDFFATNIRWIDAFPPSSPFTLDRPCSFHVMSKEVDPVLENPATLEPPDADYLFSAKVMLMSMPSMEDVYRKCCQLAEEKDKDSDERDFVHPTRLINFLVGLRGKNETMAVGGPWSPSLDGPNPDKDPSVLIKTAIRTCRALSGINLASCTQWYRFLEIYYRRAETTHKGRVVPARVETVVLFLPDVWSCLPTRLEWDGLHLNYKKQLERKLKADQDVANGVTGDEKEEESTQEVKREPTHFSELDPKVMKVNELRQELEARTLSPKGLKSQLIARLTKAIKTEAEKAEEEKEKEDKKSSDPDPPPKAELDAKDDERRKKEEEEKKKQDERERVAREKKYTLPEGPHIVVHPSRTAKSGKFDCTVMSLSLLLDYRPEDTKEHSFEVSLFAELFNEMLMRDFGFNIFRALCVAPERPKEEEKDRKKPKDKKDDDKKKDDKDRKDDKDKKDDKKNGKREEDKDDKHSKDKKEERAKPEEKNEEKDEEEEDEDDDEEDEDSKDSKRDKDKDEKDKKRDKDKDKKKKEKVKLYTEDRQLLLSFIYFDQSHCGYIFDKDIEELLYTLGLKLSRAQVRKLVQKVVTRDSLHYRKLTDKRIKSEETKDQEKDKEKSKDNSEEKEEKASEDSDDLLSSGNRHLLPVFSCLIDDGSPPSKKAKKGNGSEKSSAPEGFVMYKGALLDVQKLMDQLQRSEKARVDTENKMIAMKQDLTEVRDSAKQSAITVKDLTSELSEYKERLHDTDNELVKVKTRSETFLTTLRDIHEKITPVLSSSAVSSDEIEEIQIEQEDDEKPASVKREHTDEEDNELEELDTSEEKVEETDLKKENDFMEEVKQET